MKLYGVIGYPLGHSFSKKYFTEKFAQEGITNCRYELFPMASLDELKDILKKYPELAGINVTIPYKQLVLRHLYSAEHIPVGLRACNCIKIFNGNLFGYNTDVIGFERSLLPQLKNYHTNALVLGNGGAAEAVRFVLNKLSITFKTVSRKLHEGSDLTYADIDEKIINEHLLIINTTPLGTFPNTDECAAIPYQYLTSRHFLYDLVYNPPKSLFLQKGEERGTAIKNGHEMLVIQAEESWNIWNTAD